MSDIAIYDLADFPHWVPIISAWFQLEWHPHPGERRVEIEHGVDEWLQKDRLRAVLVAVVDGELVGTVALQDKTLPFGDTPWIAGLYVVPGFRKRGIGTRLLRAAENKARAIGLSKVYLYTPRSAGFYGAFGWNSHHDAAKSSGKAAVMEKLLTPHSLFQPHPVALRG
jgi:GNAT superfamily N-acetyltransferase